MREKQGDPAAVSFRWQNFCLVFIEAEDLLKQKISNARKILEDCHLKRGEVESKLVGARESEVLNEFGIAINSHLTIKVKQLDLNIADTSLQPYVQIKVGPSQSHQTTNAFGNHATFNS